MTSSMVGAALIDRLAAAADVAAERGLRLGIHTHDAEMRVRRRRAR